MDRHGYPSFNQHQPPQNPPQNSDGSTPPPYLNPQYNQPYRPPPNSNGNPPYNQPYPPYHQAPNSDGNPPSLYPNPHAAYPYPYGAPYHYPYPQSANPFPYPYSQPTYPSPPHPHGHHPSYGGPPSQSNTPPSLQHNNSFHQYGSPQYQHPEMGMHLPPQSLTRTNSSSNNQPQEHDNSSGQQSTSAHQHGFPQYQHPDMGMHPPPHIHSSDQGHDKASPGLPYNGEDKPDNRSLIASGQLPLDNLMADMHISQNLQSVPASPPEPVMPMVHSFNQGVKAELGRNSYVGHTRAPSWDCSLAYAAPKAEMKQSLSGIHSRSSTWDNISTNNLQSPNNMQLVTLQKGSPKILLLHGNLDIWVYEAKNLPNLDFFNKTFGDFFGKAEGKVKDTSDPYVTIAVANAVIARTFVIANDENPVWMQHFNVPVAHHASDVHFLVKDSDIVGSQLIGNVSIPVETIYSGGKIEGKYTILTASGKPCKNGAVLSIAIQYTPMKNLSIYHNGVGAGPDYEGVPGTYFPLRKGGTVALFQDAHVPNGRLPDFILESGRRFVHGKCWENVFEAIQQARRLIYITGWSVWHKVTLVRDGGGNTSETILGDLLKSKSAEGVRVLLLIWDDPTSRSILGYKTDGIMATHDEETRRFFKGSSVQVLLCPRAAAKRHSWVKQREVSTIYTHHQKTVILDADAGGLKRKIIAFVGGLDLCDGRYDTPDHHIFRTLDTLHKDDYHNPCYQGETIGCPREPWHDLHCKIDGPAAYDVLTNFEERWRKASKPHGIKKLTSDDALLKIERLPDILGIHEAPCLDEDDPESWHVQVFRSIDSSSVKGFPKNPKEATSKNLVCGKNVLIDMSIHSAYVKAIRAAQHFIYVENQYFLGSSFNWDAHKDLGADNLIPVEIGLKIVNKIRAHERFAAYIIVPMWPEGIPTGSATQRILYWQNKTMEMMYNMIYKALVEAGLEDTYTPQDYLNFFCLGNREAPDGSPAPAGLKNLPPNRPQILSHKYRRFMIYVHSKGMIVDDEFVILGSANINQRSMEGTRDTEIAMGAYQPEYTWAKKSASPRGQIYGYRMSLWAEHLGFFDDCFYEPASLNCVRNIKFWSEKNWEQFIAETPVEMTSHLLKYPVNVDRRGKVTPLPGSENFPDLEGPICGSFLGIQENLTI